MTKTKRRTLRAAVRRAYRIGVCDGYNGDPPEERFLNKSRTALELAEWRRGHVDGELVRQLDEDQGTDAGARVIRALEETLRA